LLGFGLIVGGAASPLAGNGGADTAPPQWVSVSRETATSLAGEPKNKNKTGRRSAEDVMKKLARRVLMLVSLAWIIDAADSTIYSLTLPAIKNEFGLDLAGMGMLASIFLAGTVLGAVILPVVADRLGRRIGICSCVGLFSLATCGVGIANNVLTVALGRFFTGCGTGAEWPIGAAYLSEVVPAKRRGWAMGIMQSGYPVGFFLAGLVFLVLMGWMDLNWRSCYWFLVIPGLLLCIPTIMMLQESEAWQKTHSKHRQEGASGSAQAPRIHYLRLFDAANRKSTLIATTMHIFGAVYSYGIVVWMPSALMIDFGLDKIGVSYFVMLSWTVGTAGYLLAGYLSDRLGRKVILAAYLLIGLVAVGGLNVMHLTGSHNMLLLLAIGSMMGVSVGVTVIYITYSSEIYSAQMRTVGLGFSVAIGKVVAVAVPTVLGVIAEMSSVSAALLISTVCGVLMIPAILCGPETAGRNLEDIAVTVKGQTEASVIADGSVAKGE
jgi:MFS family permease